MLGTIPSTLLFWIENQRVVTVWTAVLRRRVNKCPQRQLYCLAHDYGLTRTKRRKHVEQSFKIITNCTNHM